MMQIGEINLKTARKKGKKMVGIERFDKERSDEEPCVTSRKAKWSAATAPKISQPGRA